MSATGGPGSGNTNQDEEMKAPCSRSVAQCLPIFLLRSNHAPLGNCSSVEKGPARHKSPVQPRAGDRYRYSPISEGTLAPSGRAHVRAETGQAINIRRSVTLATR